jgi:NAD(P)-dependent dehydrogenase (short-subunit alcohol dehydrogenase family)
MSSPTTMILTGVTRGIGREAATRIATDHPDIHLVILARGTAGEHLADNLRHLGATVTVVAADLSSMASVRGAADSIITMIGTGEIPAVSGILANAGIQHVNATTVTVDGFEETFAVNVLANHLLIRSLADHLVPDARITVTSSDTHFGDLRHNLGMVPAPVWMAPDQLARPGAFAESGTATAGRTAYSTSKLAVIYQVHAFARRLPSNITIVSYNPGFVPGTGLGRNAGPVSRFALEHLMPAMTWTPLATSIEVAARELVRTATGEIAAATGDYIDRGTVTRSSTQSYDRAREEQLFDNAEQLLQTAGIADAS